MKVLCSLVHTHSVCEVFKIYSAKEARGRIPEEPIIAADGNPDYRCDHVLF
jgi:hypothetical protein